MRVLYADDDEGWRSLMSAWLASKGCQAEIYESGPAILARPRRERPDCIILDYDIGDMKGSEVCAKLKALPGLAQVPVIILTSHSGEMLKVVKEGSPDHFVVKSQSPDELFLVLGDLLKDKGWPAE